MANAIIPLTTELPMREAETVQAEKWRNESSVMKKILAMLYITGARRPRHCNRTYAPTASSRIFHAATMCWRAITWTSFTGGCWTHILFFHRLNFCGVVQAIAVRIQLGKQLDCAQKCSIRKITVAVCIHTAKPTRSHLGRAWGRLFVA